MNIFEMKSATSIPNWMKLYLTLQEEEGEGSRGGEGVSEGGRGGLRGGEGGSPGGWSPVRWSPVRWSPVRWSPVRWSPVRWSPVRWSPGGVSRVCLLGCVSRGVSLGGCLRGSDLFWPTPLQANAALGQLVGGGWGPNCDAPKGGGFSGWGPKPRKSGAPKGGA